MHPRSQAIERDCLGPVGGWVADVSSRVSGLSGGIREAKVVDTKALAGARFGSHSVVHERMSPMVYLDGSCSSRQMDGPFVPSGRCRCRFTGCSTLALSADGGHVSYKG